MAVGFRHRWVPCQLLYDFIHQLFHRRFQIAVLLLAADGGKFLRQLKQERFQIGGLGRSLPHFLNGIPQCGLALLHQILPALGLPFIDLGEILPEDIPRQHRAHLCQPLFGEVPFGWIGAVADHVDMGMVAFVVEGRVPAKVREGDFHRLRNLGSVGAQQGLPLFPVVVSQPRRILPPQREDGRPHIAGVL